MAIAVGPSQTIFPARTPLWARMELTTVSSTSKTLNITFSQPAVAGDTITFTWLGNLVVFTCTAGAPDDTGTTFQESATINGSAANFLAGVLLNPYVMQHMDAGLDASPDTVVLYSWEPHPEDPYQYHHIDHIASVVANPAPLLTWGYVGGSNPSDSDHALLLTVRTKRTTDLALRIAASLSAPVLGYPDSSVQIDEILLPFLSCDVPTLEQGNVDPDDLVAEQAVRSEIAFTLEFSRTQIGVEPRVLGALQRFGSAAEPKKALLAGSTDVDYARMETLWQAVVELNAVSNFLTLRGRTHQHHVSKYQRHWLTWYRNNILGVGEDIVLKARVMHTDSTFSSWTTIYETGNFLRGDRMMCPVGFDHMGLESLVTTGKAAHAYDVRLQVLGGSALSEEYRFHLVETDYQELHLLYTDCLGSPQVLRTSGAWSEPIEQELIPVLAPPHPDDQTNYPVTGYNSVIGARHRALPGPVQRRLKVHTGHLGRLAHKAIVDCLQSPEWYLADRSRNVWIPLTLVSGGEAERDRRGGDTEHLFSLEMEFLRGHPEGVLNATAGLI